MTILATPAVSFGRQFKMKAALFYQQLSGLTHIMGVSDLRLSQVRGGQLYTNEAVLG